MNIAAHLVRDVDVCASICTCLSISISECIYMHICMRIVYMYV